MSPLRLVLILLLAALAACDSESDLGVQATFDTAFFDTEGAQLARVDITFAIPEADATTDGRYRVTSGDLVYLGVDRGAAGVTDTGSDIVVVLEPGVSDAGVTLVGSFRDDGGSGVWRYGTIAGDIPGGTFQASRR